MLSAASTYLSPLSTSIQPLIGLPNHLRIPVQLLSWRMNIPGGYKLEGIPSRVRMLRIPHAICTSTRCPVGGKNPVCCEITGLFTVQ
jgi:hypothetical protein